MSNPLIKLRQCWLRGMILLWLWLQAQPNVLAANITVKDSDPSINYQPAQRWHASTDACPACLQPPPQGSFHEAIRLADLDDNPPSSSPVASGSPNVDAAPPSSSTSNPLPTAAPDSDNDGDGGHDGDGDGDGGKGKSHSGKTKRNSLFGRSRFIVPRDADDPVSLSFGFNGSAIYVFGFQPLGPSTQSLPTNLNLTFVIDNQAPFPYANQSTSGASGYVNTLLFSKAGLEPGPHQLVINVGTNSVFLFDRLLYTPLDAETSGNSTPTPSAPLAQSSPSQTQNATMRKHNIATFAAAIGGSVGVLGLFSLCLALSIIRRRHLAARRDRLERADHESLHTNGSDDSPHMSGPAPFVPRFFPDTVIPTEPPAYLDAVRSMGQGSTLLAQLGRSAYPTERSYADIPPDSPPPPLDPDAPVPPPPFPPPPPPPHPAAGPANESEEREVDLPSTGPSHPPVVTTSGSEGSSSNRDSVASIDSPTTGTLPELVPLLQPSTTIEEPRSPSRISTRSTPSVTRLAAPTNINTQPPLPSSIPHSSDSAPSG